MEETISLGNYFSNGIIVKSFAAVFPVDVKPQK
jgi:hypothetical protein